MKNGKDKILDLEEQKNNKEKKTGSDIFESFKIFLYENGWDDIISLEKNS